jgi:hypothetical protein
MFPIEQNNYQVNETLVGQNPTTNVIVDMSPAAFLVLAEPRMAPLMVSIYYFNGVILSGAGFEMPTLGIADEIGDLRVVAHEGRHRAMSCLGCGVPILPVLLTASGHFSLDKAGNPNLDKAGNPVATHVPNLSGCQGKKLLGEIGTSHSGNVVICP